MALKVAVTITLAALARLGNLLRFTVRLRVVAVTDLLVDVLGNLDAAAHGESLGDLAAGACLLLSGELCIRVSQRLSQNVSVGQLLLGLPTQAELVCEVA